MNKTKIVASIGPISYRKGILEEMIISGADVIRLNKRYCDYDFCQMVINEVREINKDLNSSIAVMFDLAGPSIKCGKFKGNQAFFKSGDKIRMFFNSKVGNDFQFSVDYPLLDILEKGSIVKLSEGKVILQVLEIGIDYLLCEIVCGGVVENYSKVCLPGVKVDRKYLTKQDKADILFASKMDVDFLVISNVISEEDILEVNDLLIELNNNHISVFAKIDNDIAVKGLDRIIDVCDGVVIARNDLAINLPIENVPLVKNEVINKCLINGKTSIISADLSSYLNEEKGPNRSEVSDLSSAVALGVDAIILSSETTFGHYPVDAIKQVERIINVAEKYIDYQYFYDKGIKTQVKNICGEIVTNAVRSNLELNCKAVVAITNSGYTARQISRLRPSATIIAIVPNEKIAKKLNLNFGVIAVVVKDSNFDVLLHKSVLLAKKILELEPHDKIVVVGGHLCDKHTNFMKIEEL